MRKTIEPSNAAGTCVIASWPTTSQRRDDTNLAQIDAIRKRGCSFMRQTWHFDQCLAIDAIEAGDYDPAKIRDD
jgi:hypothetical protein